MISAAIFDPSIHSALNSSAFDDCDQSDAEPDDVLFIHCFIIFKSKKRYFKIKMV